MSNQVKQIANRVDYVEVPLDELFKAFFAHFQTDQDETLNHMDTFIDHQKRVVIFKILATPNVSAIVDAVKTQQGIPQESSRYGDADDE